jgi:hypothetical protein
MLAHNNRWPISLVPYFPYFPRLYFHALLAFLQRGGDLFCAGGYAFDNLLAKQDDAWVTARDRWLARKAEADKQYHKKPPKESSVDTDTAFSKGLKKCVKNSRPQWQTARNTPKFIVL